MDLLFSRKEMEVGDYTYHMDELTDLINMKDDKAFHRYTNDLWNKIYEIYTKSELRDKIMKNIEKAQEERNLKNSREIEEEKHQFEESSGFFGKSEFE